MARTPGPILLAVDGEPHTSEAVRRALDLAEALALPLELVHVRDPYLKQFSTEIYAQGREEYLEHIERCLDETVRRARVSFEAAVGDYLERRGDVEGPDWTFTVLDGDAAEELAAHASAGGHSMTILGKRRRSGLAALRSRDCSERMLSAGSAVAILVVPERDPG